MHSHYSHWMPVTIDFSIKKKHLTAFKVVESMWICAFVWINSLFIWMYRVRDNCVCVYRNRWFVFYLLNIDLWDASACKMEKLFMFLSVILNAIFFGCCRFLFFLFMIKPIISWNFSLFVCVYFHYYFISLFSVYFLFKYI